MAAIIIVCIILLGTHTLGAQDEVRARALLEAAAEDRDSVVDFDGSINYSIELDSEITVREFDVKQLGDNLWCYEKVFHEGKLKEEVYFLKRGTEMFLYLVGENQVQLKALEDNVIDSIVPKTVGLSLLSNSHISARKALHLTLKTPSSFRIFQDEPGVFKIVMSDSSQYGDRTIETFVVANTLQVLSRSFKFTPHGKKEASVSSIDSVYDDQESVLPTKVHIVMDRGGRNQVSNLLIKDSKRKPKSKDLELKSFNIPWGTPLVDYRISRTVGFWNGQEFVEDLAAFKPPPTPSWWSLNRTSIIAASIAVIAVLMVYRLMRSR